MDLSFMYGKSFGIVSAVLNILFLLLIMSYLFNKVIEKAGNRAEGWDWFLVVIGVTYSQIAVGLLDKILNWNAFFLGLLAYSVSGFPMIYGAYLRHKEMQGRAHKAMYEK
jgi:hypothetical protein